MSRYSGKCDLYDHIMMEKMYPKDDNPNIQVSDEMECFNIFKQKTGGKIYQKFLLKLTEHNIDKEIEKVNNPNILSKRINKTERNSKKGKVEVKHTVYVLYGTEYKSLKELNNHGYYSTREIIFDTLLDIIPYYPYIIGFSYSSGETEHIVISSRSFIDDQRKELLELGLDCSYYNHYEKDLQKHYIDVVNRYYNGSYTGKEKYLC